MTEELFIIVNGEKKQLDLQTPSGINLEFVNSLLTDLSKINSSYSYTFNLPYTANNSIVLGMVENACSASSVAVTKTKAEYILNGINVLGDATMYISGFADDCYNAVLTWNVNEALQDMNDNDIKLTELGGTAYTTNADYDYENDDVVTNATASFWTDIATKDSYDKLAQTQKVLFYAGIGTDDMGSSVEFETSGVPTVLNSKQYVPFGDEFYRFTTQYKLWYKEKDIGMWRPLLPPPVVPVPYLMKKIGDYYGIKFDFDNELFDKLAVPLLKQEATEALEEQCYVHANIIGSVELKNDNGALRINDKVQTPLLINRANITTVNNTNLPGHCVSVWSPQREGDLEGWLSDYSTSQHCHLDTTVDDFDITNITEMIGFAGNEGYGFVRLRGKIEISVTVTNYPVGDDAPTLNVLGWRTKATDGSIFLNLITSGFGGNGFPQVLGTIKGYTEYVSGREHTSSDDTNKYSGQIKFVYDLSRETGEDAFESDVFALCVTSGTETNTTGIQLSLEDYLDYTGDDDYHHVITKVSGEMNYYRCFPKAMTPACSGYNGPAEFNVFHNLPDMTCLEFVKAILYAIGAQPYINDEGAIACRTYSEIKANLDSGNTLDWSNKLLNDNTANYGEVSFDGEDITDESLAQVNHFLMQNDEIDDFNRETPNKTGEAWWQHSYGKITVNDALLEDEAEVYKSPFYGAFIKHKKFPNLATGKTLDMYTNEQRKNVGTRIVMYNDDPKPILGIVYDVEGYIHNRWGGERGSTTTTTTETKTIKALKTWQFEENMGDDPQYWALNACLSRPYVVTEDMLLTEMDVEGLDYSKPIYLSKYNAFFIPRKITFTPGEVAQVELIRLNLLDD